MSNNPSSITIATAVSPFTPIAIAFAPTENSIFQRIAASFSYLIDIISSAFKRNANPDASIITDRHTVVAINPNSRSWVENRARFEKDGRTSFNAPEYYYYEKDHFESMSREIFTLADAVAKLSKNPKYIQSIDAEFAIYNDYCEMNDVANASKCLVKIFKYTQNELNRCHGNGNKE